MSNEKLTRGSGLSSVIDKLAALLPGYRGYKAREAARNDDRLLRDRICFDLTNSLHQLKKHKEASLQQQGALSLGPWSKAERRLQELEVKFRSSHGLYDGFMSSTNSDAELQERLIKADEACVELASEVVKGLEAFEKPANVNAITSLVDALEQAFSQRAEILTIRGEST